MMHFTAIRDTITDTPSVIGRITNTISVLSFHVNSLAQLPVSFSRKSPSSASLVTVVSTTRGICGEVFGDRGTATETVVRSVVTAVSTNRGVCGEVFGDRRTPTETVVRSAGMTVSNSPVGGVVIGRHGDDRFSRDRMFHLSFLYWHCTVLL